MCVADHYCQQEKANLERQLKQLNSKSNLLEKNLEKKDAQVLSLCDCTSSCMTPSSATFSALWGVEC